MRTPDILDQLVTMSQSLGNQVSFAQGGGGNTSAKFPDGTMLIKASGFELKGVSRDAGFARVPLDNLISLIHEPGLTDNELTAKSVAMSLNGKRPSIETGLHAVIPATLVAHTHNVYLNVLACSEGGKTLVDRYFGHQALWVPFVNPGLELVRTVEALMSGRTGLRFLFLQNHGFVTWGGTWEEVDLQHREATAQVKATLQLPDFLVRNKGDFPPFPGVLFPDQVVYGVDQGQGRVYQETMSACQYLFDQMGRLGFGPSFIPEKKTQEISGMDSEKYRKSLGASEC